ncbi:uncharacterized protein GGS22DRAFT_150506 [Annulohypoxylon maeteangense]|uniref:uncharacterized protein n=1 Tax=Annulohypoxylon maeteangense TaxID=1927788 RepID=UPI00200897A9|nr:uncharacterized protein GGS22DRAFT_150506 [Annulohypoxylon maeteangense]KAI0890295.1 hypothetical protein GGS22DRAFT_150506 [Annulohypoxylon maeteangense]
MPASSTSLIPTPRKSAIDMPSPKLHQHQQQRNTKNLGLRLGADLMSASCAASMVAPLIAVIDRSIMENASGRSTVSNSLKSSFRTLLLRPHALIFSKPVALIFMVYGGTYLTANTLDTATSTARNQPATHVTTGTPKFAASSAANVGLCVYKDQFFVKLFGPSGPPRPVPLPSYLLFTMRDCLTIFASFNVPPLLGPILTERMKPAWQKTVSGTTVAQFAAPAAVQILSTPVHLLGLDMFNRPATGGRGVPWGDRWTQVWKNWAVSTAARICRIVPAFGLGGTVNTKVRRNLMESLV